MVVEGLAGAAGVAGDPSDTESRINGDGQGSRFQVSASRCGSCDFSLALQAIVEQSRLVEAGRRTRKTARVLQSAN